MNIDDAARATRGYFVMPGQEGDSDGVYVVHEDDSSVEMRFSSYDEAQAARDRLNLRAVLEAIREPSEAMCIAGDDEDGTIQPQWYWRTMINALIAEVGK